MIYVASFVNEYDYDPDVRRDSLGEDSMSDLAHGYTCCAGTDRDRVLAKAKEMFIREYAEYQEENVDFAEGDIEFIEDARYAETGVPFSWRVELLGDIVGAIVIREFEDA